MKLFPFIIIFLQVLELICYAILYKHVHGHQVSISPIFCKQLFVQKSFSKLTVLCLYFLEKINQGKSYLGVVRKWHRPIWIIFTPHIVALFITKAFVQSSQNPWPLPPLKPWRHLRTTPFKMLVKLSTEKNEGNIRHLLWNVSTAEAHTLVYNGRSAVCICRRNILHGSCPSLSVSWQKIFPVEQVQ